MSSRTNGRPKPPDRCDSLEWFVNHAAKMGDIARNVEKQIRAELADLLEMKKWCDARGEKYWQRKNMTWVADDVYAELRAKADKWDKHEAIRRCHLCCDDGRRRDASDLIATICDHKESNDGTI